VLKHGPDRCRGPGHIGQLLAQEAVPLVFPFVILDRVFARVSDPAQALLETGDLALGVLRVLMWFVRRLIFFEKNVGIIEIEFIENALSQRIFLAADAFYIDSRLTTGALSLDQPLPLTLQGGFGS